MEKVEIDCGNGWTVRVTMVEGEPMITANHCLEGYVDAAGKPCPPWVSISAASVRACRQGKDTVEFITWHPTSHPPEPA